MAVNRRRKLMTIIVGETERAALKAAMARAHTHPVPWEVLQRGIVDRSDAMRIEDRPTTHKRPPSEFVDLPFGYVVAISFEEHPAGMCLHVSVSGPWPRVAPNMVVCAMIFNALDVPAEADHVWTEEFLIDGKPGGRTFNVVWQVGRGIDQSEETPGQKHVGAIQSWFSGPVAVRRARQKPSAA
jgi:hypothetical protein